MPERKTGLCLSIQQPWAWAIIHAGKDVENRTWPTRLRGRIGIHAGKRFDREGYDWIALHAEALFIPLGTLPAPDAFPRGGIVGAVTVAGCVTDSDSPWFFGEYGFMLRDPEPLALIPCPGRLSFFRPETAPR